jgi:hypothetical protein
MLLISVAVTAFFLSLFTYNVAFGFVWPVILIIAGAFLLVKALFRKD